MKQPFPILALKAVAWLTLFFSVVFAIYLFSAAGITQHREISMPGFPILGANRTLYSTEINPVVLVATVTLMLAGLVFWALLLGLAHIANILAYGANYLLQRTNTEDDDEYEDDPEDTWPDSDGNTTRLIRVASSLPVRRRA